MKTLLTSLAAILFAIPVSALPASYIAREDNLGRSRLEAVLNSSAVVKEPRGYINVIDAEGYVVDTIPNNTKVVVLDHLYKNLYYIAYDSPSGVMYHGIVDATNLQPLK